MTFLVLLTSDELSWPQMQIFGKAEIQIFIFCILPYCFNLFNYFLILAFFSPLLTPDDLKKYRTLYKYWFHKNDQKSIPISGFSMCYVSTGCVHETFWFSSASRGI